MSIVIDRLTVSFGRRKPAVSQVSLEIPTSGRLGLIGESGSGKSVTALALMGLLPETARCTGSIMVDGQQIIGRSDRQLSALRGQTMSMIFQEPMTALDPTMRVGEQLAEVLWLRPGASPDVSRARVPEMLERVGLQESARIVRAYPHQLSGGQRQRILIAMALAHTPALVICDEPTTALDVTVQDQVLTVLDQQLTEHQSACLFISHDLAVVARMCDTVAVMWQGQIVEHGDRDQVMNQPQHPYTQGLLATARLDQVAPGARLPVISDYWQPNP